MLAHARRAVPWTLVLVSSAMIAVMVGLVGRWPGPMWPLEGAAVGVLAGTAAWCLDEPSPEIADAVPRHLRWRLAAQSLGIAVVGASWMCAVLLLAGDLFGRKLDVLVQGASATAVVVGIAAWQRSRGAGQPGRVMAPYVVLLTVAVAIARPLPDQVPLFPSPLNGPWDQSRLLWSALAALGGVALLHAILDRGWKTRRGITKA